MNRILAYTRLFTACALNTVKQFKHTSATLPLSTLILFGCGGNSPSKPAQTVADTSSTVQLVDFNSHALGTYQIDDLKADFDYDWIDADNMQTRIVMHNNTQQLEISIEPGQIHTGLKGRVKLPSSQKMKLAYMLTFSKGYDFAKGGKLPGLSGLDPNFKIDGKQVTPTGCKPFIEGGYNGFAFRLMFREQGKAITYYDWQENPNLGKSNCAYAQPLTMDDQPFHFVAGVPYYVEQYVIMNDPGEHNGQAVLKIDGQVVNRIDNIQLEEAGLYLINRLYLDVWHGGSSQEWAPTKQSRIYLDDISYDADFDLAEIAE